MKNEGTFETVPWASLQGLDDSLGARTGEAGDTAIVVVVFVVIVGKVDNFDT